jgi:hypothetical protein
MRCPNCAGEIPAGSRFCGICGRNITSPVAEVLGRDAAGRWAPGEAKEAMSLFELPAAKGARTAKMALVLVLDAVLAGAGIVMILSYLEARKGEAPVRKPVRTGKGSVEVMAPTPVAPSEAPDPVKATPGQKKTAAPKAVKAAAAPPSADAGAGSEGGSEEVPEEVEQMTERLTHVVESHARDLERCYERVAKAAGPRDRLEGRIGVQLTVMPDGSARDVRASENTTGSAPLADCVVGLFKAWSLPTGASQPIDLVWPLQFRPPSQ